MLLVGDVYQKSAQFPKGELYGLTSQMRRAAISIPSNIAEGYRRSTKKDFKQFLHIAHGSLSELETQFEIAHSLEMTSQSEFEVIIGEIQAIDRMLSAFLDKIVK